MKMYIYHVNGHDFIGYEKPFGDAWQAAKAQARQDHVPIHRTIVEVRKDVYVRSSAFLSEDYAKPDDYLIL